MNATLKRRTYRHLDKHLEKARFSTLLFSSNNRNKLNSLSRTWNSWLFGFSWSKKSTLSFLQLKKSLPPFFQPQNKVRAYFFDPQKNPASNYPKKSWPSNFVSKKSWPLYPTWPQLLILSIALKSVIRPGAKGALGRRDTPAGPLQWSAKPKNSPKIDLSRQMMETWRFL